MRTASTRVREDMQTTDNCKNAEELSVAELNIRYASGQGKLIIDPLEAEAEVSPVLRYNFHALMIE